MARRPTASAAREAREVVTIGNRLAPARFLVFLVLLAAGLPGLTRSGLAHDWRDGLALAFDGAATVFLASLWPIARERDAKALRVHASQNDANRVLVLIITTVATTVVLAAISGELQAVGEGDVVAAAKLVVTLLLIWLFANSVYALHYTHAFYSSDSEHGGDRGGISFPGTGTPTFSDFAYFAFTLGMTFQTSDCEITQPGLRRIALLHSFAAFLFNIGVIAFTINVLGGLGGK